MASPTPFEVTWEKSAVDHVLDRVRAYRLPRAPENSGWKYGCDAEFLKGFLAYWLDGYDWRATVKTLNRFPQFTVPVDGFDLHFVHVVGEAEGKRPLLMSHGWPSSHYEFWDIVEPLAYPTRFGGKAEEAFDVVIPSLPGFGFSSKPAQPVDQRTTAHLFNKLMTDVLGYKRYLAQGGDWGAIITGQLGLEHASHVRAIHLIAFLLALAEPPATEEEKRWTAESQKAQQPLSGYMHVQSTKPQSLAWAMADNPVGQVCLDRRAVS